MKKYLMYLAIAALVLIVAFFAYKKIYGSGFFYEKKAPVLSTELAEQNSATGMSSAKGAMFSE